MGCVSRSEKKVVVNLVNMAANIVKPVVTQTDQRSGLHQLACPKVRQRRAEAQRCVI